MRRPAALQTDTTKIIPTKGPTMTSHDNLTAARTLDKLIANQTSPQDLSARPEPGVYALFLATRGALPGIAEPGSGALYVGSSSNLAQREFDTHFAAGETGFSTVRRSLGALLTDELNLKSRPRGTGTSKINYTSYRFDEAGERRLSEWMRQHLRVAVHAVSNPPEVEAELIRVAHPPLNLTGWPNPERVEIKRARGSAPMRRVDGADDVGRSIGGPAACRWRVPRTPAMRRACPPLVRRAAGAGVPRARQQCQGRGENPPERA